MIFYSDKQDLFERQAFEDDGVYDWDLLKKQQEQGTLLYHDHTSYPSIYQHASLHNSLR